MIENDQIVIIFFIIAKNANKVGLQFKFNWIEIMIILKINNKDKI